ncbi:hypothetical protein [Brevibacillus laterosporus]|uniref:hypothetical protein n=1 Tax=Brevibacillus laterosporus TaxID=1465 RepID=UPI000839B854|nr:hypothetical protein [Brevibacillus laterosporus]
MIKFLSEKGRSSLLRTELKIEKLKDKKTQKTQNSGIPYIEKTAHPALAMATKMTKDIGIDLGQYLMTPKAPKDNGTQVQVHIGISAEAVNALFAYVLLKRTTVRE